MAFSTLLEPTQKGNTELNRNTTNIERATATPNEYIFFPIDGKQLEHRALSPTAKKTSLRKILPIFRTTNHHGHAPTSVSNDTAKHSTFAHPPNPFIPHQQSIIKRPTQPLPLQNQPLHLQDEPSRYHIVELHVMHVIPLGGEYSSEINILVRNQFIGPKSIY